MTDLKQGHSYYDQKDYHKAFKILIKFKDSDDAKVQHRLGYMYHYGYGVEQDYSTAIKYYHLAADQGNANAQNNLGVMYQHGQGVEQDYAKAYEYYHLSVDKGNSKAPDNLERLLVSKGYLRYVLLEQTKINEKFQKQNEKFQEKIEELELMIKYMPGGVVYTEAKEDFDSRKN